eukprot:12476473-Heterocapsa_arctica.AAC.1
MGIVYSSTPVYRALAADIEDAQAEKGSTVARKATRKRKTGADSQTDAPQPPGGNVAVDNESAWNTEMSNLLTRLEFKEATCSPRRGRQDRDRRRHLQAAPPPGCGFGTGTT